MTKGRTDVTETGDAIVRREFRSRPPAGTKAVAPIRRRSYVAKLLLT
jgi:hypothetical protein